MVRRARIAAIAMSATLMACMAAAQSLRQAPPRQLELIRLPPGFSIEVWTDQVPGARSLTPGPPGVVFVGTRPQGKVYAVVDDDRDGVVDRVLTVAEGLAEPNGVAFVGGDLYVAEISRVLRYRGLGQELEAPPPPEVLIDGLPTDRYHEWRYLAAGPDGRLYLAVGAPCNVCAVEDPYAAIQRFDRDGGGREIFARGVRNSVGFDWHPQTGELWFTDNGRDFMGDDVPPDELNRASRAGLHFGYPFCFGDDVVDPEFGGEIGCSQQTPPALLLQAHVAAVGMRFYDGEQLPPEYRGQVVLAEHGSWNRSKPVGYRVSWVRVENGRGVSYQPLAEGWLHQGRAWGRPVDVEVADDGSLLVSDDFQGAIYRIRYRP